MAGDKTYITDTQGKQHRATRVHAVTPTNIVWSSNPNDYAVQVLIDGKWHRAILTYDVSGASYFDNVNIDKALVVGADGKNHTALIVSSEAAVTLSSIKTDEHALVNGTTTGETAVCTYTEAWGNIEWEDNVNVYKVIVTGSDGKKHTALLTTGANGGVQAIVKGVPPLVLPDAIDGDIVSLKAFGGCEQRNLPLGYTQFGRIHFDGNCYFDTGVVINSLTATVKLIAAFDSQTSSSPCVMWGYMGSNSSLPRWGVGLYSDKWLASANSTAPYGTADTDKHIFIAELYVASGTPYWKSYLDGVELGSGVVASSSTITENTLSTYIGARNNNGTAGNYVKGNFTYLEITQDGVCLAKIYPCKRDSDNVLGLYNTVTNEFLTNLGTGTLTADIFATLSPSEPIDIMCNNGVLKLSPNLYKPEAKTEYTFNNVTISVDNQGLLHLNGTPSATTSIILSAYNGSFTNGYTLSSHILSGTVTGSNSSIYPSSSVGYAPTIRFDGYGTSVRTETLGTIYITLRVGDSFNNAVIGFQILRGLSSSMPTYMPYGQVYADGTVETINVHGVNIIDKQNAQIGQWYVGANQTIMTAAQNATIVMRCKPNTTYYFKHCTYQGGLRAFYTEVEDWEVGSACSSMVGKVVGDINEVKSITTSANAKWIFFNYGRSTGTTATFEQQLSDFMASTIELTSSTPYENYFNGGTATCENLLSVGTSTDEQEVISGAVTRKVGVLVLDGTENVGTSNATFTIAVSDRVASKTPLICSHFQYSNKTSSQTENLTVISFSSTNIGFRYDACANAAAFKTWLTDQYAAGTPVIVVYQLASETTESVAGQPLETTGGDNIAEITQASMDGLELEVTYMKQGA